MPFKNYGVLVGTKIKYFRDNAVSDVDENGNLKDKYYHGNIEVLSNNINYRCAIDVDSKVTPVQWRILYFTPSVLNKIVSLKSGWNPLISNESSGAIDYIRWNAMKVSYIINIPVLRKWVIRIPFWLSRPKLKRFDDRYIQRNSPFSYQLFKRSESSDWLIGDNINAIEQLEYVLNQGNKVFIFGEFFDKGYGVHNIHQNQGDPIGGGHEKDNWIWQDGATIVEKSDGNYVGFFNKFATQSFNTDNKGRPIS